MGFTVDATVFAASQLVFAVGGVVFLRLGLFTSIEMNHRLIQVGFPTRQCSGLSQTCGGMECMAQAHGLQRALVSCFLASAGQPFVSPGQPFVSPGQPFVSPGQPFVSLGQPFVSPGQPFVSLGQPLSALANLLSALASFFLANLLSALANLLSALANLLSALASFFQNFPAFVSLC
jgi:hypothetical protein